MIECAQCKQAIEGRPEASISGGIMGDEYIESWYYCAACGVYTKENCHDRFCGEESVQVSGPVGKAEGEAQVALIRRCERSWDKRCRCAAHMSYFGGWLD